MCVCVCLGEDAQHGAGQGPRRGSGSGQSVAADPTVSVSLSLVVSLCSYPQYTVEYRNVIFFYQNILIEVDITHKISLFFFCSENFKLYLQQCRALVILLYNCFVQFNSGFCKSIDS